MKPIKVLIVAMLVVLAPSFRAFPQDPLTNGLVAYYPFNGNANDASAFGRDGVVKGDTAFTYDRFGVGARAIALDGTNDWVQASVPINDVSNNFTMTIWFRAAEGHRANEFGPCIIFPTHGLGTWGDSSVGLGISAGTNQICVWEHTHDYNPKVASLNRDLRGWTMATLVCSNRTPVLYVNGAFAAIGSQSPYDPVRPSNGQALLPALYGYEEGGFGGYHQVVAGGSRSFFRGEVDDIRIYNRALSSGEAVQLFEYESGPRVSLIKAVKPSFSNLTIGTNYMLQVSGNLTTWTNQGTPFIATNTSMVYPQYWDVDNWSRLFFRVQVAP